MKTFKVVITSSMLLLASCSTNNDEVLKTQASSPKLEENRLAFQNQNTFFKYLEEISTSADIANETGKLGLVSMATRYRMVDVKTARFTESDTNSISFVDSLRIPDPLLNAIINEKGEVEIGNDTIYRFTPTFSYRYHKSLAKYVETLDTSSLKSLKKGEGIGLENGVYAFRNQIQEYSDKALINPESNAARTEATAPLTGNTRMNAAVFVVFAGFYSSVVINTKVEREKCNYIFGSCVSRYWAAENASNLGYNGTVSYSRSTAGVLNESGSKNYNRIEYNRSSVEDLVAYNATFLSRYEITYRDTYHFASANGGTNSIYNP